MRYAYYPGCYAKDTATELDVSTRAVCSQLDIELEELTAAPCCGAGDIQQTDSAVAVGLGALVLAQAARLGLDVLTVCNVCTLSLRQAALALTQAVTPASTVQSSAVADPGLASVAGALPSDTGGPPSGVGRHYPLPLDQAARLALDAVRSQGYQLSRPPAVTHLLWVLRDAVASGRLQERVQRPLDGVVAAPFYGCQILRPSALNGEDVADDPRALEDVLTACGVRPVDHDARLKCCGWPITFSRPETAGSMARGIVASAVATGASMVVTPCPLCHAALEQAQLGRAGRSGGQSIPVLHLPEVVGLAFGLSPRELRLDHHMVDTRPLIARLGMALA